MAALSRRVHRSLAVFSSRPTDYRANFCGSSRQINLFSAPSPGTVGSLGLRLIKAWRAWCSSPGWQSLCDAVRIRPLPSLVGTAPRRGTGGLPPRPRTAPGSAGG